MSAGWDIRRWGGDEWPDKRISIVDEDGYCLAISPRFARAEDVKYMELMAEAPKMQEELATLQAALEQITRTHGSAAAVDIAREALLQEKG